MPHKNKNAPLFLLSCVIHQANQDLLVGKPGPQLSRIWNSPYHICLCIGCILATKIGRMNAKNKNMQRNQYQKHHEIQEKI